MKKRDADLSRPGYERQRVVRLDDGRRQNFSYYSARHSSEETERPSQRLRPQQTVQADGKRRKRSKMSWFFGGAIAIVLGFILYVGSGSNVTVLDSRGVAEQKDVVRYEKTVEATIKTSLLNHNKATVDSRGVARNLKKNHPELQSAVVTVPIVGNKVNAYVTQYPAEFILRQGSSRYGLTSNGYIIDLPKLSQALPVVNDETGEEVTVGGQLLPESHVSFIKTVVYELAHNNLKVSSISLPSGKAYEINVYLKSKPFYIKFNLAEDAMQQSGAAVAVMRQLGSTNPQYIDLRVPGRAYYK